MYPLYVDSNWGGGCSQGCRQTDRSRQSSVQRAAMRCAAYLLTASCSSRRLFSCFTSSCCSICCFMLPSDSSLSSPRFCSCRMPLGQAHRFAGFRRYESAEGSARVGDMLGCAAASWIALLRANRCHVSLLWRRQAGCGRACPPCTYRSGRGSLRSPDRLPAAAAPRSLAAPPSHHPPGVERAPSLGIGPARADPTAPPASQRAIRASWPAGAGWKR